MDENKSGIPDLYIQRYHEFISLAAHDLDSPLRKLSVFVDKLSESIGRENAAADKYIKRINACVGEMRSLVSSFSELDSLAVSKGYVSCNISAIIQKVLNELKSALEEKHATISYSSLPVVQGNSEQYQLLFKKLLENSVKFAQPGVPLAIDICAEQTRDDENRCWHKIIIEDNGIGFADEDADRIFEPFGRLNGKSAYPGSGFGLTIARRIAENHGGKIFARGQEKMGSRFILMIPENPENIC